MAGMNISIVGTGYVGLVTGVCLAEKGHRVVCVDVDRAKVDAINAGRPPIHEDGLPELLARHAGTSLTATTDLAAAVLGSDVTFVATGTPFDGRVIDLRYVKQVAADVGAVLARKAGYHVVVVKSTVVPGTTDDVVRPLLEQHSGKRAGADFGVGMNPEFLSEGVAVEDFMRPDRIVLGGADARAQDALAAVYAGFGPEVPRLRTNNKTAEMIKYASNAYQAANISFANELANLCAALGGIDALDVMAGVHAMKELTPAVPVTATGGGAGGRVRAGIANFLSPGCGFGGSCFPKDVKALIAHADARGVPMPLLTAVIDVNRGQPAKLVALLAAKLGGGDRPLAGKRVAVLGLAFKPGTDDMRESPSIPIIDLLLAGGAAVTAFDPIAMPEARKVLGDRVAYADGLAAAVAGADGVLLVTRWPEFKAVPAVLAATNPAAAFVDGRRLIDKAAVPGYAGIGLGA